ncbi:MULTISPECIES: flagellar hook-associated protein FlgK [unclassified Azospirillum]|uniref:flagellar hook-associated protein FlgK n=1 Tax=unclassified Azospirillum TaxID=2630922 RepID=UPI000B719E39|nr:MULTISPECIES: flagellar hook-associated protein FlgK [unclassified Azospirillum]SNS45414.1 flagellar hook-associated protein 1 FlgK [Azospirillum sp. RU38E]SNS64436.1 flagellar hook-associated protein 1 FlgK [Azospirillum sp. RU37A]
MTISVALQNALSGMQANQSRSAVISRNIANASTEGYTRKQAVLTSLTIAGEGRGVTVASVERQLNASLVRETRVQSSAYQAQAAKAEMLTLYTDSIGQPADARSISSKLSGLEQALVGLEELPDSAAQQRAVVDAAVTLANGLNSASDTIADVRQQADAGINDGVTQVNTALKQMEDLNRQIGIRTGAGQDTSEMEDQRDRLLDQVASLIDIQYFTRAGNEMVVMTSSGVTLLDERARTLEFTPTPVIGAQAAYPGGLSGLKVEGVDIAPASGSPQRIAGGRIAGLFAIRDEAMPEAQRQVDEVASVLTSLFQSADASVTGTGSSATGLFTDNGQPHNRAAGPVLGMADRIRVNDRVLLSAGGDPSRVVTGLHASGGDIGNTKQVAAFIGTFSTRTSFSAAAGLSTSNTIKNYANAAISQQHTTRAAAQNSATTLNVKLETVKASREAAEGVNIEEELQDLMLLERSFAANAQIMQAAGRMLDKLLEI